MNAAGHFVFNSVVRLWMLPLATALLAVACGGGVDTGGTGSEPQTVATGPVSGFGSIIVDGVHFDESAASIVDDDGTVLAPSTVKLGMMVEIEAGAIGIESGTGVERAGATRVLISSELRGPVQSVDTATGSLEVLGQMVKVNFDTFFDGLAQGLAELRPGQVVEVHALAGESPGVLTATRIELKAGAPEFKLKGAVSNLDAFNRTFSIGGASIAYADVPAPQSAGLSNGMPVHVRLNPVMLNGHWIATRILHARRHIDEGASTWLEGFVTDFASLSQFRLNGIPVDVSRPGVVYKRGSSAQVADGVRLKINGRIQAGVLVASKVDVKPTRGGDDEFQFHGEVQSPDAVAKTFLLRGVLVQYTDETRFAHGAAVDLSSGARVQVDGLLSPAGDRVMAARINFEASGSTIRKHKD